MAMPNRGTSRQFFVSYGAGQAGYVYGLLTVVIIVGYASEETSRRYGPAKDVVDGLGASLRAYREVVPYRVTSVPDNGN
jgi:hypothetical protein